jgi:hypothetical protein
MKPTAVAQLTANQQVAYLKAKPGWTCPARKDGSK